MIANKGNNMGKLLFAILAAIGISIGGVWLFKIKAKKTTRKSSEANEAQKVNTKTLDKVYETLFESDLEVPPKNPKEEAPVLLKLEDRTWWGVNKSVLLSSFIILVLAAGLALVSVQSQKAYSKRQEETARQRETEYAIQVQKDRNKMLQNELQMTQLGNKLDSIDAHIKQLKPAPKPVVKKKSVK